jgi:hypothetical protein
MTCLRYSSFLDGRPIAKQTEPHGRDHEKSGPVGLTGHLSLLQFRARLFRVEGNYWETVRYDGPWELPPLEWRSKTVPVFLRLLFRAGLLTMPQRGHGEINVEANSWANLLFADTVGATLRNVAAYEQFHGRCEAWPNWLRDRDLLTDLLNRELLTMDGYNDVTMFSQVIGQWPPPLAGRWKLLLQRVMRTGARLDR